MSVSSWAEEKVPFTICQNLTGKLLFRPFLRHRVGDAPVFDLVLAAEPQKRLQWCGHGALPFNTYLAVGQITACYKPDWRCGRARRTDLEIVLDCELPLHSAQVGDEYCIFGAAPYVPFKALKPGTWLAGLGQLSFTPCCQTETCVAVRLLSRWIVDLRVDSPTFGCLIPWEFGAALPFDDTHLIDSMNYYVVEVSQGTD